MALLCRDQPCVCTPLWPVCLGQCQLRDCRGPS
uniref:Uncharacterized protein n=1 Tax=Anguilla anguilla TaxID=7936 RepID=A0A0E9QJ39_ANGAN